MPTFIWEGGEVGWGVPVHHKVSDAYAIKCRERNSMKRQYLYAGKKCFLFESWYKDPHDRPVYFLSG